MDPRLNDPKAACVQTRAALRTVLDTASTNTAIPVNTLIAWRAFDALLAFALELTERICDVMDTSAGRDGRVQRLLELPLRSILSQADTVKALMASATVVRGISLDVAVVYRLMNTISAVYPQLIEIDTQLPMSQMTQADDIHLTPIGDVSKLTENQLRVSLSLLGQHMAETFNHTIGEGRAMLGAGMMDRSQLRRLVQNYKSGMLTYRERLNQLAPVFLQAEPLNPDISSFCWVGVRQIYANTIGHLIMYDRQAMELLGDR